MLAYLREREGYDVACCPTGEDELRDLTLTLRTAGQTFNSLE